MQIGSTDDIEMFVQGIEGTANQTFQMNVSVIKDANDAVVDKAARDAGLDSSAIEAVTGLMDFNVTIPDAKDYGSIVSVSWVLPEGTTNPSYLKQDPITGSYSTFSYDSSTGEGARWDPSTNTLTVYVRDDGKYDANPIAGVVRDPGFIAQESSDSIAPTFVSAATNTAGTQ